MAVNLTKYHKRTPRSKWDGSLRLARIPEPFEGRCDACGYEGHFMRTECPECCRFVARPRG